jgi:phosphate transport system substrate-binding protein
VESVVVITHPSNPVAELTVNELRGIFSGRITNWSELGGADRDINVVTHASGTASNDYFMGYLFGNKTPNFLPAAIAEDSQNASNVVYLDRNAIGYVGHAFLRGAHAVSLVNECGIATRADAFSAKTEEYALSRRMYLYNRSDNLDAQSQALLDFAISEAADGVIGKSGFIDLGITSRSQGSDSERAQTLEAAVAAYDAGYESEVMEEMLAEMGKYDRLSSTFRFRTGSSRIDERGRLDMQRLIDHLEDAPSGTQVKFVGFTDSDGAFDANRRLSFGRASAVLKEVNKIAGDRLAHVNMQTTGFGEIAPSACNVSDRGKAINRRVEVWISTPS